MTIQENIGFIGIGLMGRPMTLRLLQAGYRVTVWNRSPAKLAPVIAAGAAAADSIAALVQACDIVLLSLTDTAAVDAVVFDADGVAASGGAGKLLVDLSSIAPQATRRFAEQLQQTAGMGWVDAPVSGGVPGAEQGNLAIMAGGAVPDVERARPVLAAFSRQLTHMGEVGAGQICKICNQMIVACNAMVIAEMIALAQRAGVDAARIPEALQGGFADSRPLQILGPEMANGVFEPVKWRVQTLLKDLSMAGDLARLHGSAVPMSALAAQLMQCHGSHGWLDADPATLIKLYQDDSPSRPAC
ncbi:MAG: NAD(P)-dependent oxidoreductase [Methylococcaceae bacterium]|nr:MAG: NAD(P)-dependent oxidoreductase [Methylococcaceae bacterium]